MSQVSVGCQFPPISPSALGTRRRRQVLTRPSRPPISLMLNLRSFLVPWITRSSLTNATTKAGTNFPKPASTRQEWTVPMFTNPSGARRRSSFMTRSRCQHADLEGSAGALALTAISELDRSSDRWPPQRKRAPLVLDFAKSRRWPQGTTRSPLSSRCAKAHLNGEEDAVDADASQDQSRHAAQYFNAWPTNKPEDET